MTKDILTDHKTREAVRKAYRAGRKTIEIDGRKMTITRKDKNVVFNAGGEQHRRKESWLVLKPADGKLVPIIQIELKNGANLRSSVATKS